MPQVMHVAKGPANHQHVFPLEKTGGTEAYLCRILSLGTALEAKCASAGRVCLHQHLAVLPRTSSFLQGFAAAACSAPIAFTADSAVCSDFLPSLELSHPFPKCQKSAEP